VQRPVETIALPATVQALLAARIDRLAEREKAVLHTAAVIGQEFTEPVPRRVAALPEAELAAALRTLVAGEFVYEEALYPEAVYSFKHPLTQEVAYGSQLAERRRQVHAAVARAIEETHPTTLALVFGALLAAGVVWAPKLMLTRGLPPDTAQRTASVLWLGLAAGCIVFPWWSDVVRLRKPPVLAGIALQLGALLALVYLPEIAPGMAMVFWLVFGFGGAAHMLAFSAAGDAVKLEQIGTSAAIVNGTMFLLSGALIARPGDLAERLIAASAPEPLALAQVALRPLFSLGSSGSLTLSESAV